jgi:alkanesulfonate monooxygenase SsuD/methylene tetrahydromethanopterin reductase-like flavin-dependent oxidoreductase (luciferase family)
VPIALAALSSGSIRLAGELADAWSPFLWARSRLEEGRALLAEAESATPTHISVGVPVALGPDEASARKQAAWWLSTYCTRMGPLYPRMLGERFGMAAGVDAVIESPDDLPAAAEELARDVLLMGTYDRTGDLIQEWLDAGADSVHLVLPPERPAEELAEIVRTTAAPAASSAG